MAKYPKTLGRIEAVWDKLGGEEGVTRLLRGELVVAEPTHLWREEDGVIYFFVTSYGATGEKWIASFEKKDFCLSDDAKSILSSEDFRPTWGVTTEVAVLKGMLFADGECIIRNIRDKAYTGAFSGGRKLFYPNAEVACLIREKFSNEEIVTMGLQQITTMHEPINNSDGDPFLLCVDSHSVVRWLRAEFSRPDGGWGREVGLALAIS